MLKARTYRAITITLLFFVTGLLYKHWHDSIRFASLSIDGANVMNHQPKTRPLIPHILHQTWDSYDVPVDLSNWIKSWRIHNPKWEYWFWTPDDVRALLKNSYPDYLNLYNSYRFNMYRSDAMRYFIMDTFGGFYADIDMECFKPLDDWTFDHQCLLSHETYEHPSLLFHKSEPNVMTTIIGCRPGHPFYKQVYKDLPEAFKKYPTDVLNGTGPIFLDRNFRRFNKSGGSFLTTDPKITHSKDPESISVVPPSVFLPTYDPMNREAMIKKCRNSNIMNQFAQRTCEQLKKRNFTNAIGDQAYTNHYWVHFTMFPKKWTNKKLVSIFDLIPDAKTYRTVGTHTRQNGGH